MTDSHYVLLPQSPWAGPTASQIAGPEVDLHRGVPAKEPTAPFVYELRVDDAADDPAEFPPLDLHHAGDGHLLVTPKLVECLKTAGVENLQTFPAQVTYAATGATVDYRTANIVGLVSALDTDASQCEVDENGLVEVFYTLRLRADKLAGLDLFRLHESFHTIIVSRRVKEALESASITGLLLLTQEEWQPGML